MSTTKASAGVMDILGTVSQTGGIPTGAIIERGSNANGEYVKYADGTLICTDSKSVTTSASGSNLIGSTSGTTYYNPTYTFVFASVFIAVPIVNASSTAGGMRLGKVRSVTTTGCGGRVYSSSNSISDLLIVAIGRWF